MHYSEIVSKIEKTAPPRLASDWDRSGLQVAAQQQEIKKIALCLDPTPSNLQMAVQLGAQFVLTHHPLFLKPLPMNEDNLMVEALRTLFRKDLWLYSAHTSLDQSFNSQAQWLSRELGLTNCRVLDVQSDGHQADVSAKFADADGNIGFGVVGDFANPLSYAEFAARLRKATDIKDCSLCGHKPAVVSRMACCPGSGGSAIYKALESGAQVFITGDIKYHAALDLVSTLEAVSGRAGVTKEFCVLDLGHFSIEEEMMRRWSFDLDAVLPGVEVVFIASSDPLRHEVLA